MIKEDIIINDDQNIKEQLYMLYLEIKGELSNKNIEIDKDQFDDYISNVEVTTLINYIKELVGILFNQKFPEITKKDINSSQNELLQLENYIQKLEQDIRYYAQRDFQQIIQKNSLEMKIEAYMEIENEYEELKEKVKYEAGKFLNNDRKDNEIIILRQENGILKKEIKKNEEMNKKNELIIKESENIIINLKKEISILDEKISKLESNKKSNTNNSSINININNNGSNSSKWIIKHELAENQNSGLFKKNNNLNKTNKLENFKNLNGLYNIKKHTRNKLVNTIDNSRAFTNTYNKLVNNLNRKGNNTPNKNENNFYSKKNNSISVDNCPKPKLDNTKYNKKTTYKSNNKNNCYNKVIGIIQNSKFPLSSKKQLSKKNNNNFTLNRKYFNKNCVNHSSLSIRGNSREYY